MLLRANVRIVLSFYMSVLCIWMMFQMLIVAASQLIQTNTKIEICKRCKEAILCYSSSVILYKYTFWAQCLWWLLILSPYSYRDTSNNTCLVGRWLIILYHIWVLPSCQSFVDWRNFLVKMKKLDGCTYAK